MHDDRQAAIVAHTMFTLWDLGWDSAPYYLYVFSRTADTNQDFGLLSLPTATQPGTVSDAWRAYQTIAQTFYNHRELTTPPFTIRLRQSEKVRVDDSTTLRLAPPDPFIRAWIRGDQQLLIYLVHPNSREPRTGRWDILLKTDRWGCPQEIPLLDYRGRREQHYHEEQAHLVITDVEVGLQPRILTLTRR